MVKYFVTGGSGYIGSHVILLLQEKGFDVLALSRSDKSAATLEALGVEVLRGDLEDLETLKKGAREADGGVIHLAFIHDDFNNMHRALQVDLNAIKAFEEALEGTNKAFVGTSSILSHRVGTPKIDEKFDDYEPILKTPFGGRLKNDLYVLGLKDKGIRSSVIRLSPTVHNDDDAGFAISYLLSSLNNKVAGYIGDGLNAWTSIHINDAASLFVLAAEKGIAGHPYHGVTEESITIKDMSETIAEKYNLETKSITPQEADKLYDFLGEFLREDTSATNEITKKELGWEPKGKGLLEDLKTNEYSEALEKYGAA